MAHLSCETTVNRADMVVVLDGVVVYNSVIRSPLQQYSALGYYLSLVHSIISDVIFLYTSPVTSRILDYFDAK